MNEQSQPFEANKKIEVRLETFRNGLRSSNSLALMQITPRTPLVGNWLKVGDLGFIFAARGIGKTWFSMFLAKSLATQTDFGPWKTHCQAKVLYLDGEMPPEDLRARDLLLGDLTEQLVYGNHELIFEAGSQTMNLVDPVFQEVVLKLCSAEGFNVLFFDNLSTLALGMDENKGADWEQILPWLLALRRAHITVIFVHHAGRNNQMRGSSKREDPAFWIIRLDDDSGSERSGASFFSRFTKWRNASDFPQSYRWHFLPCPSDNGKHDILIEFKEASNLQVFLQLVEDGLDSCSDIAAEMDVTTAYVSKLAKQALKLGRIKIDGRRRYLPG